jgi:tetratricopeptide (TPR) repeat protein
MHTAEAYTEFTSTPVVEPSTLEDTRPIRAVRKDPIVPTAPADAPASVDLQAADAPEPAPTAMDGGTRQAASREAAYEEFLKDASEPVSTLPDHLEELGAIAPMTRVSQAGDVRIAMDTQNAHVWNELGNVYLNSGACDDAIAAYSKAIELDRQFAWPYSNLALAYVQKGRLAEAILLYQRGIELFASDKDKAVTWNRLGNVYRRLNDYANAIAAYQTADDLDPDNATLSLRSHYGLLGNLYLEQKSTYVS